MSEHNKEERPPILELNQKNFEMIVRVLLKLKKQVSNIETKIDSIEAKIRNFDLRIKIIEKIKSEFDYIQYKLQDFEDMYKGIEVITKIIRQIEYEETEPTPQPPSEKASKPPPITEIPIEEIEKKPMTKDISKIKEIINKNL
jgi:hypothetical protein